MSKPGTETIYDRLLADNRRRVKKGLESRPISFRELADETVGILNAGTEPTATMLVYATYFYLRFPHVQAKILAELRTVELDDQGRLPLVKLEALPYFVSFHRSTLFFLPVYRRNTRHGS